MRVVDYRFKKKYFLWTCGILTNPDLFSALSEPVFFATSEFGMVFRVFVWNPEMIDDG